MNSRLLKVVDVAEILGVGIDWVYERIKRGELPVVELGDTRKNQRIAESDLAMFIAQRRHPTTPAT
ncbi:helix-turn-helix domain-containing protein [Microbacterium sp. SA39]|uniref:helix-turn-helix domain-containing protein n=1 Tax=Microbacterium sp. SA39 TaxID=1263625 RepID=UPI0005FA71D2|nr:helix-turn-helix domain-containing protein [Microbacterium sp. SA39]KJQ54147.1 Helix-turn-helix domain protein [Microbacterium sp. SA39]